MASSAVHIPDMWDAILSGAIPGAFTADGAAYVFPVVSTVDSRGGTRHWQIQVQVRLPSQQLANFNRKDILSQPVAPLPGCVGVVTSFSWHDGGEQRKGIVPTEVSAGKNLGKKNATNVATQALRDALGLYNKQVKRGSVPAEVPDRPAGVRPKPMLVKKIGATKDSRLTDEVFRAGVVVQRKLNGVRMVAHAAEGEVVLYSRTGGDYLGMPAIHDQLAVFLSVVPKAWTMLCAALQRDPWAESGAAEATGRAHPSVYLDGELYKHGKDLRWISGEARRTDGGSELEYWIFDCFFPELGADVPVTSRTRQRFLDILFLLTKGDQPERTLPHIVRVANFYIPPAPADGQAPIDTVMALAKQFVREGFEGAIARKDDKPYRYGDNGYHSSNLVKIKPLYDDEFPVVGYTQGTRGKDVGAVIWKCVVPAAKSSTGRDEEFNVVPKNITYEERYAIFQHLGDLVPIPGGSTTRFERDFKGRPLTVEYPELSSKTGIPTQAKALAFRVYEQAPGVPVPPDPITKLLEDLKIGGA
jgi:hypothetical protein